MGMTTAETIRSLTRQHLTERGGLLLGQCVTAVGWIGGTVPDCEGIVEIPMTDVAGPAFAVGAALAGRRPIFVVRYQGFMWYNASSLVNYAARSKDIWGVPVPIFIRAIGMEGGGIGHTASSCLHSIFMHPPGMPVAAPMTPGEYLGVWQHFLSHDDPLYVSEHRRSFSLTDEMPPVIDPGAGITIFAISAGRLNALEALSRLASLGIAADLFHLVWLKPLQIPDEAVESLRRTGLGVIVDSDFEIAGAARSIAYELMHQTGVPVHAVGLEDRACGVSPASENLTPSATRITAQIQRWIRGGPPATAPSVEENRA